MKCFKGALIAVSTMVLLLIAIGCSQDSRTERAGTYNDNSVSQKLEYRQKLQGVLDNIYRKIGPVQVDFDAPIFINRDNNDRLGNLNQMKINIDLRMAKMNSVTENEWPAFKAITDSVINSVNNNLKDIKSPGERDSQYAREIYQSTRL
jgi:hypothetical protein